MRNLAKRITLDWGRFIASLMIVAIHIYPFQFLSASFDYLLTRVLFRIAVPFFLMITGYFLVSKVLEKKELQEQKKILKSYTKKIIKLYFISILIYLPINIYNSYFSETSFLKICKDVLINGTFYHLWYFPSLILGLWISYYILRTRKKSFCLGLLVFLYLMGLLGDSYYGITENFPVLKDFYHRVFNICEYTRNGLFYVPIFLSMGYWIHQLSNIKLNYKDYISFLISLTLMVVEGFLLYQFKVPRHTSMYIMLIPSSYFLFKIMLNFKNSESGIDQKLRGISTWIYILHPLLIVGIHFFAKRVHLEDIMIHQSFLNYFLVVVSTLALIIIFGKVKEMLFDASRCHKVQFRNSQGDRK